uniref:Glycosyl transferase n=1 Tax=Gracilinema caldarium TaxID=215591 RepID=A0A7C3ELG0_9SPIR
MSHIIIAMIEVGYGHKGPALAIKDALEAAFPGKHRIEVIDFPRAAGALRTDASIKAAWNAALQQPWMVRASYALMEAVYPLSGKVLFPFMADFFIRGAQYLAEQKPDLFISTHPMCSIVAAEARRRQGLTFPIVIDVVDPFDGYSLWAERSADLFLVHSSQSRQILIDHGIDENRIRLVPYPRLPAMGPPTQPVEALRRSYGLDTEGKPVLLVTSGAQGLGRAYSFASRAYLEGFPADFLVVTGKNEKIYENLTELVTKHKDKRLPGRLIPLSFVPSMAELYSLCDMVVGKAGASTCMEALSHKKPMICTEWAGQNDYTIIQFLLENRLGSFTPRYREFIELLSSPPVYEKYDAEFSTYGILQELRSFYAVSGSL